MPIPVLILLILIFIYLVFIVGPAVTGFFSIFKRPLTREPENNRFEGSYRAPFEGRIRTDSDSLRAMNKKRIWITSFDGTRLCADFFDRGKSKTALLIHGYSTGPYLNLSAQARWLLEEDFSVLMIFQRAHEDSEGDRSTLGLKEQYDLLSWIDWLDRHKKTRSILIYGASMGATSAAFASNKIKSKKVKAVIFDSPFASPYDQMLYEDNKRRLPGRLLLPVARLTGKLFLKLDIKDSPEKSLQNNRLPSFFLHGTEDETVPIEQGERLYEACASEKDRLYIEGANHLMGFMTDEENVKACLSAFIEKYL